MSIHVALHHVTHYSYDKLINLGPQIVRLRPAPHCRTPILSYSLKVEPAGHFVNWQQDPFANYLARLVFPEKPAGSRSRSIWWPEMSVYNPFDFFLEESAQSVSVPAMTTFGEDQELARRISCMRSGRRAAAPVFRSYVEGIDRFRSRARIDFLVALNQKLQQDIGYLRCRMEPGVQTPVQTLELGSGSCRDSGWLLVQIVPPSGGIAARFVSGYLIQLKPDVKALDGPGGTSKWISPTCTPGARFTCPVRAGSDWIPLPDCWRAKGTFRSLARRSR